MAEENQASNQPKEPSTPQFAIDRIFVKDVSLESPKGLNAFNNQWKPRVDLDINTSRNSVGENLYEVVLRLTVTVKDQESEDVYYLIEVKQAGVFVAQGFSDEQLPQVLATIAPSS